MKSRDSELRWFGWFGVAFTFFLLVLSLAACASAPVDRTTFVPLTIRNNRNVDPIDPQFYLVGMGTHSLGIVPSLSDKTLLLDTRWFPPDGCVRIVAHYTGEGSWTSNQFCWRRGERIEAHLENLISTSDAWSHR